MIRTDDLRRRGLPTTAYGYGSSSKSSGGQTAGASYFSSHIGLSERASCADGARGASSSFKTITSADDGHDTTAVEGNVATVTAGLCGSVQHESDVESQTSSSMVIKQTKAWEVKR